MIAAMGVYVITDDIVRQQEISLEKNSLPLSMGIYQPYSESNQVGGNARG